MDIPKLYIWTGWLAFAIFIPLAATSMDMVMRRMGRSWKTLQRTTYAAAILTLIHWAALHGWGRLGLGLVHFVPLAVLEAYRVFHWYLRPRTGRRAAQTGGDNGRMVDECMPMRAYASSSHAAQVRPPVAG